ncbi:MAG: GntR family transcriptional regulator [Ruthenibacterium sp.]
MTLKRDAQMPLYQQMANEIKAQIASGELRQNEQLMTEMELSREFGVSRITVRKALELLVEEDILSKRQGVGAFVTGKKLVRSMNVMMGFTQTCEANGQKATSRLLFAGLNEARPADIKLLGVKEGDSVISLRRLRFCDNVPVMVEEVRLQRSFAYLLGEDLTGSLHKLLAESGIKVVKGVKTISISYATKEESTLLGMGEGAALLLQRDISYDENGQAVYRSKSVINADRYTCTITMQA